MNLNDCIKAFSGLGVMLRDILDGKPSKYSLELIHLIDNLHIKNQWFTPDNVRMAIRAIADQLTLEILTKWTSRYPELNHEKKSLKTGVIMAGNIPLVGFHDFLSVLITGNSIIAKTSSKDSDLITYISKILCDLQPEFYEFIRFTEGTLSDFDIVIATGSNNSARYFGLGCRNVSKLYVPEGYDFSMMIKSWNRFSGLIRHSKYANNYDFNKAVYLVNKETFTDIGYLMLKENPGLSSPVAVLYYEYYKSTDQLERYLDHLKNEIQCSVSKKSVPFGKSQMPALWDYADGTDTIDFLLKKNIAGIL